MKKLIFTAIALVAFSSASMANSIADEKNLQEKNTNEISKTFSCVFLAKPVTILPVFSDILTGNCSRAWGSTRIYALNAGATELEANFIANSAWLACVGAI